MFTVPSKAVCGSLLGCWLCKEHRSQMPAEQCWCGGSHIAEGVPWSSQCSQKLLNCVQESAFCAGGRVEVKWRTCWYASDPAIPAACLATFISLGSLQFSKGDGSHHTEDKAPRVICSNTLATHKCMQTCHIHEWPCNNKASCASMERQLE